MNEITKLAFIDELEKIGFVDSELLKEAFFGKPCAGGGATLRRVAPSVGMRPAGVGVGSMVA